MKKALIVWGGWDGHEPEKVANRFARILRNEDFEVEISDTLTSYEDLEKLKSLDLIIPIVTGGVITNEQMSNVSEAVAYGVGMAGCHGGMCDSFHDNCNWKFITGATWVSHPGNHIEYMVNIKKSSSSPLVYGLDDFKVYSEQYYLHVDPAVNVLATTRFPVANWYNAANGYVDVPVSFTKMWGMGRVFYSSLGHHDDIFDIPEAQELQRRGMLWAAEGKALAGDYTIYHNDAKMF